MTIVELLKKLDVFGDRGDDMGKKRIQVISGGGNRYIYEAVENDIALLAYAHNPGNGIIIINGLGGAQLAYGCIYIGFPIKKRTHDRQQVKWEEIPVRKAVALIKKDVWVGKLEFKGKHKESSMYAKWDLLSEGKAVYTYSFAGDTIAKSLSGIPKTDYRRTTYKIYKMKNGDLRTVINDVAFSTKRFAAALVFYKGDPDIHNMRVSDIPKAGENHGPYIIYMDVDNISQDIVDHLKEQTMKKAFLEA